MVLNKNQIEVVRYQLKKLNQKATNDEIRDTAANYKDFDAVAIANEIVNNRTSAISTPDQNGETPATNNDNQPNFLALLDNQPTTNSTLSTAQKQQLVQIKAQELGIELVDTEVIKIADMVAIQITDSIQFLDEVASLIQQFFSDRNNQAKQAIDEKINDIATIINTGNEQLGDIFNGANQRLNQIVEECQQRKTDYKSTYKTKLEGIREILKLPA